MTPWFRLLNFRSRPRTRSPKRARRQVNRDGWDAYARTWDLARGQGQLPDLPSGQISATQHLGDEWSLMEETEFPYGVPVRTVGSFTEYIDHRLLMPYLPAGRQLTMMEIGPGGGRITALLLPHARRLYAVDLSPAMLELLQRRFAGETRIVPVLTDGTDVAGIPAGSLDVAVSFDAFVHMEPWEIYRYLEITRVLLREGGVGIVHFSDVQTPTGFKLFQSQVRTVVEKGVEFGAFSVMSKGIMETFLTELGLEIVVITNDIIPRDAVAVFRRKGTSRPAGTSAPVA